MGRLDGKVAVITGGNSGVGAATAKLFAKEGATVVITARREAALKEVADEITAAGGEVYAVSTDISKPEDPEALMQKVMDKYGKIDILVNNAGILEQGLKPVSYTHLDVYKRQGHYRFVDIISCCIYYC